MQIVSGKETTQREDFDTEKWKQLGNSPQIRSLFAGEKLKRFLTRLFRTQDSAPPAEKAEKTEKAETKRHLVMLEDQSWLRVIGKNGATPEHAVST